MAAVFEGVNYCILNEDGQISNKCSSGVTFHFRSSSDNVFIDISNGQKILSSIPVSLSTGTARVGNKSIVLSNEDVSYLINFKGLNDAKSFETTLKSCVSPSDGSIFTQRTDASSAEQYFQFYGYMSQQQNMMQDYIRTSTYQRAMLDNIVDFQDKVVLDVGAGSGILSFFAVQAGARKVYAIEASSMAKHCQTLVNNNKLSNEVVVIAGKIEEVNLPEQVDLIVSEPMGYMLFNERMLETYLHAKKWLKPGGKMFPTQGDLHIAPFTDEALYMEQCSKANFWYQNSFHSVDLSSLREAAIQEYFRQPIVDTFDIRICLARSYKHTVNFQTAHESDLYNIDIPVSFIMLQSGTVHGLAFWFDVAFLGSQTTVWLSTAPTQPLTHWYQVRCLLQTPIFVKQGQTLVGKVLLKSNKRQSYDVEISLGIPGTTIKSSNSLDLKNPFFRYTGQQPQPPPGNNHSSPSDSYWNQQDLTAQNNAYNAALLNGSLTDGNQLLQSGAMYNNLLQIGNMAQVNASSLLTGSSNSNSGLVQHALQTRTSIGGGISPVLINQQGTTSTGNASVLGNSGSGAVNHYMIGDYMLPSNSYLSSSHTNSIGLVNFKSQ